MSKCGSIFQEQQNGVLPINFQLLPGHVTALQIAPKKKSPWYAKKMQRIELLFLTLVPRDVKTGWIEHIEKKKKSHIYSNFKTMVFKVYYIESFKCQSNSVTECSTSTNQNNRKCLNLLSSSNHLYPHYCAEYDANSSKTMRFNEDLLKYLSRYYFKTSINPWKNTARLPSTKEIFAISL